MRRHVDDLHRVERPEGVAVSAGAPAVVERLPQLPRGHLGGVRLRKARPQREHVLGAVRARDVLLAASAAAWRGVSDTAADAFAARGARISPETSAKPTTWPAQDSLVTQAAAKPPAQCTAKRTHLWRLAASLGISYMVLTEAIAHTQVGLLSRGRLFEQRVFSENRAVLPRQPIAAVGAGRGTQSAGAPVGRQPMASKGRVR